MKEFVLGGDELRTWQPGQERNPVARHAREAVAGVPAMHPWDQIRQLVGRRLHTLERAREFIVDAVGDNSLVVIPKESDPRAIRRDTVERAVEMSTANGGLTLAQLRKEFPKNQTTSYIAAIVSELSQPARSSSLR